MSMPISEPPQNFFFFDIFAIHLASRHEKCCQMSVRLFSLFQGSRNQQWLWLYILWAIKDLIGIKNTVLLGFDTDLAFFLLGKWNPNVGFAVRRTWGGKTFIEIKIFQQYDSVKEGNLYWKKCWGPKNQTNSTKSGVFSSFSSFNFKSL